MSKNSKILIVTLLVLALIGGALFFTKPELFKGMLDRKASGVEGLPRKVTPAPGLDKKLFPKDPDWTGFPKDPDWTGFPKDPDWTGIKK